MSAALLRRSVVERSLLGGGLGRLGGELSARVDVAQGEVAVKPIPAPYSANNAAATRRQHVASYGTLVGSRPYGGRAAGMASWYP